jgi:CheY-like chemotaxis protein
MTRRPASTLLVRLLRPHYRLAVARDGEEGLRIAARRGPPDLILLDVIMPGHGRLRHLPGP